MKDSVVDEVTPAVVVPAAPEKVPQDVWLMTRIASEIQALAKSLMRVQVDDYDEASLHRAAVVRLFNLGELVGAMAEGIDDTAPVLERLHGVVQ